VAISAKASNFIRSISHFAWIAAFLMFASPCAPAVDSRSAATQSSLQSQAARENASPNTRAATQQNPNRSPLPQTADAGEQQVMEQTWSVQQGAPQYIQNMTQTADGFLWLGGSGGLFRFDGTRFERFHTSSGDQLLSTNVYSVFAPSTGGLWIGYTFGGFSFLKNGRVKNYGGEIASKTGTVVTFAQDSNGVMWAGTSNGVWRFEDSAWRRLGAEWGAPIDYILLSFDRAGTLWVMTGFTNCKLFYLLPGSKRFQLANGKLDTWKFLLDADRKVVTIPIAPQEGPNSNNTAGDGLHTYPIFRKGSAQIMDRAGSVWILPDTGPLMRIQAPHQLKDALTNANARNSETYDVHSNTNAWMIDREGNVWFADERGVHRFFYISFSKQKVPVNELSAIAPDDEGGVWIGIWGQGQNKLYRAIGGRFATIDFRTPIDWTVAYPATDGTLWFGGAGGLFHLVDRKPFPVALPRDMTDQATYLQTITEDRTGGLWVSFGRHGLYRLANGRWTSFGGRDDLPKTGVVIAFTDSRKRVWFGFTKNQVSVLDGEKLRVFGQDDGVRIGNVTAISGRGADVWIGGEFGLQKFDNGRFLNIGAADEDWLLGISGIVETADGDLWLNGLSGIFHIGRAEIAEALKNPSYRVKGQHLGIREGLPGFAAQIRPLPTAIESSDGRLWFSLSSGVVWLDPTHAQQQAIVPPLAIQSVSADDKNYEANSTLTFPAHTASVGISYSAISLSDPEAIRSRVKLRETDADWHEVSTGDPVNYRNLAPGHYHFSVDASDTNGVWSDNIINVDFTIMPAWYQTNWFRALCVCAFFLVLWALYQIRVKQLEHQFNVAIEARVNERTRIARDLHDTLLQSFQALLPHLQTVSNVLPSRPDEAKRRVDSAIDQATNAITDGRDTVHALRSGGSTATKLGEAISNFARELLSGAAADSVPEIQVRIEGTPRSLNPVVRDEVYRIATEAIRNAVRHSHAGLIEVEIRYDEEQLRLRIGDDGEGIDPAILNQDHKSGHWGLLGMRERAKLVGGTLEVWSQIGKGTEVELSIPAASVYAATPAARWSILSRFRRS
jgi:signal transduction histidine kinase/ligand-binding sensor domain-containing protein